MSEDRTQAPSKHRRQLHRGRAVAQSRADGGRGLAGCGPGPGILGVRAGEGNGRDDAAGGSRGGLCSRSILRLSFILYECRCALSLFLLESCWAGSRRERRSPTSCRCRASGPLPWSPPTRPGSGLSVAAEN